MATSEGGLSARTAGSGTAKEAEGAPSAASAASAAPAASEEADTLQAALNLQAASPTTDRDAAEEQEEEEGAGGEADELAATIRLPSAPAEELSDLLDAAAEEELDANGVFIDFLKRRRASADSAGRPVGLLADTSVCNLTESQIELNGLPGAGLAAAMKSYVVAVETLNREKLVHKVLSELSGLLLEAAPPAKREAGELVEVFRGRAWELSELKAKAKNLKSAVSRWLIRQAVTEAVAFRDSLVVQEETAQRRHERLQEFWPQMHESSGKLEPERAGSREASPPRGTSNHASSRRKGLAPLDAKHMTWKDRASRSSCPAQRARQPGPKAPTRVTALAAAQPLPPVSPSPKSLGAAPTRAQARELFRTDSEDFEPMLSRFDLTSSMASLQEPLSPLTKSPLHGELMGDDEDTPRATMRRLKLHTYRWWQDCPSYREDRDLLKPGTLGEIPIELWRRSKVNQSGPEAVSPRRGTLRKGGSSLPSLAAAAAPGGLGSATSASAGSFAAAAARSAASGWRSPSSTAPTSGGPGELPMEIAFDRPWKGGTRAPPAKAANAPSRRYLRACQSSLLVPSPSPFVTGHSKRIRAAGKALADADLAVAVAVMRGQGVEEVNLAGSCSLSEQALTELILELVAGPSVDTLQLFSLQRCRHAGQPGIVGLLSERLLANEGGAENLRRLDLGGVPLKMKAQLDLCRAIRAHGALESVSLADTGLGTGIGKTFDLVRDCISEVLGSKTLRTVDLGWNCFTAEMLDHIGECLAQSKSVQSLDLTSCASAAKAGDSLSPVTSFMQHLGHAKSLTSLNVSLNRIDFRAALVLEDALETNDQLSSVAVSHNPLGVLGVRSLLRLLARVTSGLKYFSAEGCESGQAADESTETQVFSATTPGGRYALELERPYHRALLRMLYKKAERLRLSPEEAFRDIVANPAYSHPAKDKGVFQVPLKGSVALSFSVEKAVERDLGKISETSCALYLDKYLELLRIPIPKEKEVALLGKWARCDGGADVIADEQRVFLDALCKDFRLTYPQFEQMCQCRHMVIDVVSRMLPCLEGARGREFLAMGAWNIPTLLDCVRVLGRTRSFAAFNAENATGRYKLDLSHPSDYAVAEQLSILDAWETFLQGRSQRSDVSQRGDQSQARNVRHQEDTPQAPLSQWHLPEHDVLQLDYVSARRPPKGATPLDERAFRKVLTALLTNGQGMHHGTRLQALRWTAHEFHLSALQVRRLLTHFGAGQPRADAFAAVFNRVVDMHQEKAIRGLFSEEEVSQLRKRLGQATFFPFLQPEGYRLNLDLANSDERLVGSVLATLAAKQGSLKDLVVTETVDGVPRAENFDAGPPATWQAPEKMPKAGTLTGTYLCEEKDRGFGLRRDLFEKYSGWRAEGGEEDMTWWSVLTGVPDDVILFLCFLAGKYADPDEAFDAILATKGAEAAEDGVVGSQAFYDSMRPVGCLNFAGLEEAARIEAVFAFMLEQSCPPGSAPPDLKSGQVNKDHFRGLFRGPWEEVKWRCLDVVSFFERCREDDLHAAWASLDPKGTGKVSLTSWTETLERQGFLAPASTCFHYLDRTADSTISKDDFVEGLKRLAVGLGS